MSLRFYFGPSGAGKSRQLYEEILTRAQEDPRRNFLVIVPDQFTMQTQKDLVLLSPRGGIMNIDVLSFGRLTHRILEEVGVEDTPVLDDTGKSLVLQRVASGLREELPVLGSLLKRQGYIHEVKSAISEFMQYGIGADDVSKLIDFAAGKGALALKLKDLEILYKGFLDYIRGNFITTEEKLDLLRRSLVRSKLLPGSVVIFDGFTGFTPIQNRLIQELMRLCGEVIVSLTLGEGEDPYLLDGEQRLFHLTKKTVADLDKLAKEACVERKQDVFVRSERSRFANAPALKHLERNLFRYPFQAYGEAQNEIRMFEAATPREEVHQTGLEILRLIREEGAAYRDLAVITGDLEGYAPYVETEFARLGIPCFLDRTRGIVLNPMIECISAALELFDKDFSYETVFHYLRSGLTDIAPEDVDELENYCVQTGLRGYRKWNQLFTHKTAQMKDSEEPLQKLNALRQRFMEQVRMLRVGDKAAAKEYVDQLYEFLTENEVQSRLLRYENRFANAGELSRAKEYAQIYRLVMELLEQIYALLGEETITLREFIDILQAGFGEIEVGTIPQNVDRVVAGDMERTRLKQVKYLFFLGVNDGNIPKSTSKGGIISDMDREFLRESQIELAPSPRQQMYIQRLYLYLNMTKPSKRLYLAYSKMNSDGKSIRPAYLIDVVRKIFPDITVEYPQSADMIQQLANPAQGKEFLARRLREYAEGITEDVDPSGDTPISNENIEFFTIYQAYGKDEWCADRNRLTEAAFQRYQDRGLASVVAKALYGKNLENSVTRLETFAACAYRHFLQYGLSLKEREAFDFENVDMGNIYHAVLETFADKLKEKGYTWFDFPEEFARQAVREALEACGAAYGDTVLYSSARNEYAITRMGRILTRTVLTLQYQLNKGTFQPQDYELSFQSADDLASIHVELSEGERMHLRGRIDRIDTAEDDGHVYVKVIDYKSGGKQFDLVTLYYGLQLQLVVYMNAALEHEAGKHPDKEIVPAAMLYYHIDDPTVETPTELSDEELREKITAQLKMNGVVNSEPGIVEKLDRYMQDKSDVIPVERRKDGTFGARSGVLSGDELHVVSDYVNHKIRDLGQRILEGNISLNPYQKGTAEACTYCPYKKACPFDPVIPGCAKRQLAELDKETVLARMREDADEK